MLNVTMHWYGFQMLTIRSSLLVARRDLRTSRAARPSDSRSAASAASTAPASRWRAITGATRVLSSGPTRRVELLVAAGSRRSRARTRTPATRPARGRDATWRAPIGCQPLATEPVVAPSLDGERPVQAAVRPEERLAVGVEAGDRRDHAKNAKWSRRSRYSVLW